MTGFATGQRSSTGKHSSQKEHYMFTRRVKVHLAGGCEQRMSMEDYDFLSPSTGKFLQALAEINLLAGEEFIAESADFAKCLCFAEDERASHPA